MCETHIFHGLSRKGIHMYIIFFLVYSASMKLVESSSLDFQRFIKQLSDSALRVSEFQDHINGQRHQELRHSSYTIAQTLSKSVSQKFTEKISVVRNLRDAALASVVDKHKWGTWTKCCSMHEDILNQTFDSFFSSKVNLQTMCSIHAANSTDMLMPNHIFLMAAEENLKKMPSLKWQYFGSETGILTQYPASLTATCKSDYDNRFRPWYVQASSPKPKDVVIVLDQSGSMMTYNRMDVAKKAATTVLHGLSPDDRTSVITFSDQPHVLGPSASTHSRVCNLQNVRDHIDTSCYQDVMASATSINIRHLVEEIKNIVPHGQTFYGKALSLAFKFLEEAFHRDIKRRKTYLKFPEIAMSRDRVILFLSDGQPSDRPSKIFKLIKFQNQKLFNSVVIMCYALGKGTFGAALQQMASQHFDSRNSSFLEHLVTCVGGCRMAKPGVFHHVDDIFHLRQAFGSYYTFFSTHIRSDLYNISDASTVWSVPYFDALGQGMVISASLPVIHQGNLFGVVGVDTPLHDLMIDTKYFHVDFPDAYAFITDLTGRVLIHPFLPLPANMDDDPVLTSIEAFIRNPSAVSFINDVIQSVSVGQGPSGEALLADDVYSGVFQTKHILPSFHQDVMAYPGLSNFSCSVITQTTFILCVVTDVSFSSVMKLASYVQIQKFNFLYHRFDLSSHGYLCPYKGVVVAINATSVNFGPLAFEDVADYYTINETRAVVTEFKHYIETGRQQTILFLKSDVRNIVWVTWILESLWKASFKTSLDPEFFFPIVIWRYFCSKNSVFRIFPGVEMPKQFDCTSRPWYKVALASFRNKFIHTSQEEMEKSFVTISPPFKDILSGELIISVSAVIVYPSQDSWRQLPQLLGVMSADITMADFSTIVLTKIPQCNSSEHSCIVLDFSGYLVYDENLFKQARLASQLIKVSNYHIINSHPGVASILLSKGILVKHRCLDLSSVSYRTYFYINSSQVKAHVQLPFILYEVLGTNAFVIVVKNELKFHKDCVLHLSGTEACLHTDPFTVCESPCIDCFTAKENYETCQNIYNHHGDDDSMPCMPEK
ncbi:unnamed protein product [Clavelina lepadiformis]|uniref:VWFA domain-containing protein n=1 Tax=Clavelina lepadiformis TaxID=159417 RepID=A0ABP0GHG3_CLALP